MNGQAIWWQRTFEMSVSILITIKLAKANWGKVSSFSAGVQILLFSAVSVFQRQLLHGPLVCLWQCREIIRRPFRSSNVRGSNRLYLQLGGNWQPGWVEGGQQTKGENDKMDIIPRLRICFWTLKSPAGLLFSGIQVPYLKWTVLHFCWHIRAFLSTILTYCLFSQCPFISILTAPEISTSSQDEIQLCNKPFVYSCIWPWWTVRHFWIVQELFFLNLYMLGI